jgi:YggT family protein
MNALIVAFVTTIQMVITLYIWIVIIAAFLSFVQPDPRNPVVQTIYRLTEPAFDFIRRKMPFVVFSGIDLSPLVIIFGLNFINIFLDQLI